MLFGRGLPRLAQKRNRRMRIADGRGEAMEGSGARGTERRRSTSRAASSSSHGSNVIAGYNDDDNDFMPMAPRPEARGIGPTRSSSRGGSSSSRGSNVIPGDNVDDDDFMPMAPRHARPRSPEDPDDVCPSSLESRPIRLMAPRMDPPSLFHMSRAWYPISYPRSYPH